MNSVGAVGVGNAGGAVRSSSGGGAGGGSNPSARSTGSARDAIVGSLRSIGTDPRAIQSIAAALPDDNVALRDLLVPVGSAASGTRQPLRTGAQAAVAFNDVVNSAFRNASEALTRRMFGTTVSGSGGSPLFAGFGAPLDAAVYSGGFRAGTGLPPVGLATPNDFAIFETQLIADLGNQRQSFAKQVDTFQKSAQQRGQVERALTQACLQYATSQFLGALANLVLGLNIPSADVLGVLSQLTGLGYSGLTPQGTAYLDAYCCDIVRSSGINPLLTSAGGGSVTVGGVSIDLASLLGAIPGLAGTPAGTAAATIATAATNLGGTLAGIPSAATRAGTTSNAATVAADTINAVAGAVSGTPMCGVLDWMAFALQGDARLQNQFNRLMRAAMSLDARLVRRAVDGANQASNRATNMINRLGRSDVGMNAVANDPALAAVIDAAGH
ncbi:hypothetical protein PLESTB_000562300 [Pleodorina starrii]|uniref:Uncharacterized protein n=1 Tax=Pleodorina starrii TaxID=330485 RepID=A0A9W6F0A9_9CHLO|nr:hypothetical protein PLESTB_000562300 [Pleodorina starrii]